MHTCLLILDTNFDKTTYRKEEILQNRKTLLDAKK